MKKIIVSLFLVLGLCSMLNASPASKEVVVTEKDNGKLVKVRPGQILVIALKENPSTGYKWSVEYFSASLFEQLDTKFKPDASGRPGAPGHKIFGFNAKKLGNSMILLEYKKPWEKKRAKKEFSVRVSVATFEAPASESSKKFTVGITLSKLSALLAHVDKKVLNMYSSVEISVYHKKVSYLNFILANPYVSPKCMQEKLPVTNKALRNIVNTLLSHYGDDVATRELGFMPTETTARGYIKVTFKDSNVELLFNISTGKPVGKLPVGIKF